MSVHDAEKRRIIQRLIKKLSIGDFVGLNEDYITTASKYTGLHPKVLKNLETEEVFETNLEPVDRSVIYEKLVQFYLVKAKLPTTYDLFICLHEEIPPYIDIGSFRKLLVKMDFVWKKITPNNAVVIENPLVRFKRYNYLKKIQFYRSTNTDIYYIDNGSYNSLGQFRDFKLTKEFLSEVLNKAWVQRIIYAVGPEGIHSLEDISAFTKEETEVWVRDSLLPKISQPSVFILKNPEHHNGKLLETPSLESLKSDIILWLDRHGVTYDPKMSKYELFALAEKYTDLTTDLFKIDQMLKIRGHTVLRIPTCIENMTPAALLYRVVNEILPTGFEDLRQKEEDSFDEMKALFRNLFMSAGLMYIEEFERHIAMKEAAMVVTEDKVDEVYDNLVMKAGNGKQKDLYVDSDLPSCSDSE